MDAAGIIISESYNKLSEKLTEKRTLAALPFASKYRLIDFALSNMVNSGIRNVGLIEGHKYNSLMDHVQSGSEWDLDRKHGGLTFLPPYSSAHCSDRSHNRLEALLNNRSYLRNLKEKHIVLCGTGYAGNVDFRKIVEFHQSHQGDITYFFSSNVLNKEPLQNRLGVKTDANHQITRISTNNTEALNADLAMATCVMERNYLLELIEELSHQTDAGVYPFLISHLIHTQKILAYTTDEMVIYMEDLPSYLTGSLALLDRKAQESLFHSPTGPIITKAKDSPATYYGQDAQVENSLIADGVTIEGQVRNCVIFRGARIKKGAVIENSVIMQDSTVGENATLSYAVLDKKVIVNDGRNLSGYLTHPFYCKRNEIV